MTSAAVASADSEFGQHGHYLFLEDEVHPAVTCTYTGPHTKLTSITVKPPKVWWPDTISENHTEHGKTGWRVIVQTTASPADGPWHTARRSAIQKATAFEDSAALYGDSTKAPFTRRTLSWDAPRHPTIYVRVVIQAFWYHADGSVMGWEKHTSVYYRYKVGAITGIFTNSCSNFGIAS